MATTPTYRVIVKKANASLYGPGTPLAEFENAKNLGHSEYINDVGEAFWTVTQGDPKLAAITDALLNTGLHALIYRGEDLVWAGTIGEVDETETDVVFYAYSYEANLFWLHTAWNAEWYGKQINTVVDDSWTRMIGLGNSGVAWMSKGTIQTPVTTSGGSTPILLPRYTANYKRYLFLMQEMAGVGIGDTTNRVVFEITPSGVFNFWANRGTTRTDRMWEYGGVVAGYNRIRAPADRRNIILGVGSSPNDIVLRDTEDDTADRLINTRREEAVYYSWVRDSGEIDRVTKLRLKRALRTDNLLSLSFYPGKVTPARATGADYAISDMVPVKIDNHLTVVNEAKLVVGQRVIVNRGQEIVRVLLQDSL